jgi:hypothetical protein
VTLDDWRKDQSVTLARLGVWLGVTEETARRYCLPEGHALSRMPPRPALYAIHGLTQGLVAPNDFLAL